MPAQAIGDKDAMGIRHVLTILAVHDLERATRFYADALALERRVSAPTYVELAFEDGRAIGLYERRSFAKNTHAAVLAAPGAETTTATELYLQVDTHDELAGAVARLRRAGALELSPASQRAWGDVAAYFADPDGNVLVVAVRGLGAPGA